VQPAHATAKDKENIAAVERFASDVDEKKDEEEDDFMKGNKYVLKTAVRWDEEVDSTEEKRLGWECGRTAGRG
jgi:hypothetical protein